MEFHFIQEYILRKLIGTESFAKYSDLRLEGIENDLFNYHLQKLVKEKLIDKSFEGYRLSLYGMKLTEDIVPIGVIRPIADLFKLYSHGIVIRKDSKGLQILNRRRTKQPFYGDKGILGESVKKGEDSKSALQRRLKNQAGINANISNMIYAGTVRKISRLKTGELFSDFIFNFHFCLDYEGNIDPKIDSGNVFWVSIDEAIQNENESKTPIDYLVEILTHLKSDPKLQNFTPSFREEFHTIENF